MRDALIGVSYFFIKIFESMLQNRVEDRLYMVKDGSKDIEIQMNLDAENIDPPVEGIICKPVTGSAGLMGGEGGAMLLNLYLIFSGLSSLIGVALLAARLLGKDAVGAGRFRFIFYKPLPLTGERFTARDGLTAVAWAAGALCLAYGVSILYCGVLGDGISWTEFARVWRKYDAAHYMGLAEQGYRGYTEGGRPLFVVFFPLYPWLVRLLHLAIPDYALCGHILSALCYLGSAYLLARLTTEEFGRRVGAFSVAFLTAYPFSFFFAAVYTESLFLLLSLGCFYAIRRHRYPLAGLLGALAALSRMQGVLLAAVAFAEYCVTENPIRKLLDRDWRGLWQDAWEKLFWMAFMGLGTLVYLGLNYAVTGDPFRFLVYQRERWFQGAEFFLVSLAKLWSAFIHPTAGYEFISYTTWGPQLVLFVFCVAALLYGVRRLPPTWTLYYAVCIFLNYSLSNPLSGGRYIASAFPLPVLLAVAGCEKPGAGRFLLLSFSMLQGVFLLFYLAGKHVC